MTAQLDLFASPPPVARAPVPAMEPVAKSSNGGVAVNFSDDGTAALITETRKDFRRSWRGDREIVELDPKRLQSRFDGSKEGDVRASYSAQSLCESGRVTAPFRFRGGDWVQTGGLYSQEGDQFECYRLVALDAFDGSNETYSERNDNGWEAARNNPLGGYHGMKAKHGARDVVLVGPPIVIVEGQPEQGALL